MRAKERFVVGVLAAFVCGGSLVSAQSADRRQLDRIEETLRREGEAVIALADAALRNERGPADFALGWHHDFLKAQHGTFVPFIVSVEGTRLKTPAALLYVRATRRLPHDNGGNGRPTRREAPAAEGGFVPEPVEEIYSIDVAPDPDPVRVARGFSLPPGQYEVVVVVRERESPHARGRRSLAATLRRPLDVPDLSGPELMTSTIMLADRLTVVGPTGSEKELKERPYVIGGREIVPAADRIFRPDEELIVVFLVYNPFVTPDKHFDLEVEYHFSRQSGTGATYFNRTEPQRFTPASLGPEFNPSPAHPVMAGQGVPLTGFPEGDYRLTIRIRDRLSGRSIAREVMFAVKS